MLHCAKSNLNKSKDVYASLKSYKESVKQAKILLPLIEQITWDTWQEAMYTIAKAIVKKAGKTWQDTDNDNDTDTDNDKKADKKADKKGK